MVRVDLFHCVHGPAPLINLLVWVAHVDDLAFSMIEHVQQNRVQILCFIDHDVIRLGLGPRKRPQLQLAVMTKRQASRAIEHGRPEITKVFGYLPGEALELFWAQSLKNAIAGDVDGAGRVVTALEKSL